MEKTFHSNLRVNDYITHFPHAEGMISGLIGGLFATMVMDLVLMGVLSIAGLPALTCFSIVGSTLAHFFSVLGVEIAGGIQLGVIGHYLIGPMLGAIFGVAVTRVSVRRLDTAMKIVLLAIVYIEIVSQPILALTPLLLKMTAPETLQWFGESFVVHLLWGVVFGGIMSQQLRLKTMLPTKRLT